VFRTATVTSAETLAVTIQTVDATTGAPTGSLYGSMVEGTVTPTSNTTHEVTFGTGATAVAGDVVAVVIEFDSAIGNLQIAAMGDTARTFPYCALFTASWAKTSQAPVLSLRYDDGSYSSPNMHMGGAFGDSGNLNSSSSPDEYALKFSLPMATKCSGLVILGFLSTATTGTADAVLYDSDGTTPLASVSLDPELMASANVGRIFVSFATPQALAANTFYRIAFVATGAGTVRVRTLTAFHANQMVEGDVTAYLSTRTNAGAWTDTATSTRPLISPRFSAIDIPAGGGGEVAYGSVI
jgi:hypothetical protein